MRLVPRPPAARPRLAPAAALLAATLAAVAFLPGGPPATAQPPALPAVLRYVPADAAVFLHAETGQLWGGALAKTFRAADPKTFDEMTANAKATFGTTPDRLRSLTLFYPRLAVPQDSSQFGVVLAFTAAYDADALKAGLGKVFGGGIKFSLHTPSDRLAVVLVGLDEKYAEPRPAGETGPLSPALREAASGTHAAVAAATLAKLPDALRGDDLPPEVRAFQPILKADVVTALVGLDKELAVEVRVKAATAAGGAECAKAFETLLDLARTGLDGGVKEMRANAGNESGTKEVLAILDAARAGLKAAKVTTDGTETRARAAVPADLPFGPAFLSATTKVREAAARATSQNNLKQLALALHSHHDTHGVLPPAAVADKGGKPLLSWRVAILPYVEQDELYKQFKLDEPWDGPNNKKLIDKMPKLFALPTAAPAKGKPGETHYRVFVGNGAAFNEVQSVKIADFTDGLSNTILIATAAESVPWTKPDELAFDPEKDVTKLLGYFHGGCSVAFADGSVRLLTKTVPAKTLAKFITRAGGEVVDEKDD